MTVENPKHPSQLSTECGQLKILMQQYNYELDGISGEINDANGNKMPFIFRPALNIKAARTLIILHGHGSNKSYSKFKDDNWNVIIPLDLYGTEQQGSWWMGENGDLKTYNLLQNLIKVLTKYYNFSSLYFWGSSMGGYGAIVHGFELNAIAIYSHIPQIKLKGTAYTDGINSKFYHSIFNNDSIYTDLNKFITGKRVKKSPVLFLSQNTGDKRDYINQHFLPFIMQCNKYGFAYSVTMPLVHGHTAHLNVANTVKQVFEANYAVIKKWRVEGTF